MNPIFAIARKEWSDHVRNGWVISITAAFAIFSLAISLAGFGVTGSVGVQDEQATLASLTSLVIYLIPLLGLLLGYDAVAGEHERGTMDLLLSFPLRPAELLIGKWLGLSAMLAVALALGLTAPAALALWAGQSLMGWLVFAGLAAWLGAIFVAVALLLSTLSKDRGRLLGLALGLWLMFVVLFDLLLIGLLVATKGELPMPLVSGLFLVNPTSLFRFLCMRLLASIDLFAESGFSAAVPDEAGMVLALALWAVVPLAISAGTIRKE